MTPKEKAKKLVDSFYCYTYNAAVKPYSREDAKKCALIAVDEIISALVGLTSLNYWENVKQEIEKL